MIIITGGVDSQSTHACQHSLLYPCRFSAPLVRNCSGADAIACGLALPAYNPGVQPDIVVHEEDPQVKSWIELLVEAQHCRESSHWQDCYKEHLCALNNIWKGAATRTKKTKMIIIDEIYDIHLERTAWVGSTFDVLWPEVTHLATKTGKNMQVNNMEEPGGEMSLRKAVELMFNTNMEAVHAPGSGFLIQVCVCFAIANHIGSSNK